MPATLLLTPALAESLADAVRRGVPIETASQAAGISPQTFYDWVKCSQVGTWRNGVPIEPESLLQLSAFSEKIRQAQADFESRQIAAIAEAGEAVGRSGVPEWRARAWLLNNHPRYRERYRQHRELEVHQSGTVLHEHQLASQLDDSALTQAYEAFTALPPGDQGQADS
jgi:transposase-like protein